jgi:NitT/TauT family transport system ATP-binding protein
MSQSYEIAETLLKISGVNVAYNGISVLKNCNAEINNVKRPGVLQGQVVGLLGPSGVGKTTLFRVLAGLMTPDSGQVLVGPAATPVTRGSVGVVAQDYPLFAHRTVVSNLTVAAQQAGAADGSAKSKAMAILERFGLGEQASKFPAQLSGGQRQRVAIAQQLLCSDHLLLMDEPFSGLDPVAISRVVKLIGEVAQTDEEKTIVIVTHDVAAALETCDTIWLLGRDFDANNRPIPGARVQKIYDLMALGLAWEDDLSNNPIYLKLLTEIRAYFPKL